MRSRIIGAAISLVTLASAASAAVAETANPCNCKPGGVSFLAGDQTDKLLNDHKDPASSMPVPYLSRSVSSLQATFTALNASEPVETHPDLAEQIFIVDGGGKLQVGGTVLDDKQISPSEKRGTSITGGRLLHGDAPFFSGHPRRNAALDHRASRGTSQSTCPSKKGSNRVSGNPPDRPLVSFRLGISIEGDVGQACVSEEEVLETEPIRDGVDPIGWEVQ